MPKAKKDYLVINRAKWKTGSSGKGVSSLLNNEGFMCCLGFRCHQMGIPKRDLLGWGAPGGYTGFTGPGTKYHIPDLVDEKGRNTAFCKQAMKINDNTSLTNEIREKKIIKHFAKKGITVEFTGEYPKA